MTGASIVGQGNDERPPPARDAAAVASAVSIVEDFSATPVELLRAALSQLAFPASPEPGQIASAVILLDFSVFALDSPAVVNREIVEGLIDLLAASNWTQIAIVSTEDSAGSWLANRGVAVLADLLGYQYVTPAGSEYDIVDLAEDVDSKLGVSRIWLDADLRIVLSKCRTDQNDNFALCCNTLLSALPLTDKQYHYRLKTTPWQALLEVLRSSPPQLAIVDACGAVHGTGGQQAPIQFESRLVIAGRDILAVDSAAAIKMGADPFSSPVLERLIAILGRPSLSKVSGSLAPLAGFRLPDPRVVETTRLRNQFPTLSRLVAPWLQCVDTEVFPFKHPADAKCNEMLSHRFANMDADPAMKALLIYVNWILTTLAQVAKSYRYAGAKDQVQRRREPVSERTRHCTAKDYIAMEDELDELRHWLAGAVKHSGFLRWQRRQRAVVFECQREYPVPFVDFVSRIDISKSIQYMNDYIGGSLEVVSWDEAGRALHQVERNLYLPQPNYVTWWGGKEIDVSKIESVKYEAGEQRMYWMTLESENKSAVFDDGIVTFADTGQGTRITIFGRQLFNLPPLLENLHLERYPELEDHLTEHAYATFFTRTFSNFEALLEGREIAIGKDWYDASHPSDSAPRPIDVVADKLAALSDAAGPLRHGLIVNKREDGVTQAVLDQHGFSHFGPSTAQTSSRPQSDNPLVAWLSEFWCGYAEAIRRDLEGRVPSAFSWPGAK